LFFLNKRAVFYLENDQVSLAIGKGGFNIKLATRLTGYQIEVYRVTQGQQEEDDVELEEFLDEIDAWIIEDLKRIGLDTAKSVLRTSNEDLVQRTQLEEETVAEVKKILQSEFEE
jgi:N utilization substance protein A